MNGKKVLKLGDICDIGRGSSPRPITDRKYLMNMVHRLVGFLNLEV